MDDRPGVPLRSDLRQVPGGPYGTGRRRPAARTYPGLFIAFEGGDGTGKSTQARVLADWLRERPGARRRADPRARAPPRSGRSCARCCSATAPAVPAGRGAAVRRRPRRPRRARWSSRPWTRAPIVITDRYVDSSIAYQGAGRDLDADEVARISRWATGGLVPDLTVLLDLDPEIQRVAPRHDPKRATAPTGWSRCPRSSTSGCASGFLELARRDPHRYLVLDGSDPRTSPGGDPAPGPRPACRSRKPPGRARRAARRRGGPPQPPGRRRGRGAAAGRQAARRTAARPGPAGRAVGRARRPNASSRRRPTEVRRPKEPQPGRGRPPCRRGGRGGHHDRQGPGDRETAGPRSGRAGADDTVVAAPPSELSKPSDRGPVRVWDEVVGQERRQHAAARGSSRRATGDRRRRPPRGRDDPRLARHRPARIGPLHRGPGLRRGAAVRLRAAAGSCHDCRTALAGAHPDVTLVATEHVQSAGRGRPAAGHAWPSSGRRWAAGG